MFPLNEASKMATDLLLLINLIIEKFKINKQKYDRNYHEYRKGLYAGI